MSRPARAIVDLDALRHNYQLAQSLAPNARALGVVKANAYGHGAVAAAQALEPLVPAFAVACMEEALELRAAGLQKPILLLEGAFTADEIETAAAHNCWLMVSNREQAEEMVNARPSAPLQLWLKADTGMHRLGLTPQQVPELYRRLQALPHVQGPIVIATHFAVADEPELDFTRQQIECLQQINRDLQAPLSLANSAGILAWPGSHAQYTRPGIMLYGSSPFATEHPLAAQLQAVMTLESKVIDLHQVAAGESVGYGRRWIAQKDSIIATVAIGYGDGYPRHAPDGTPVLVNGQRCPLAGRVSMDMITVDVTTLPSVNVGDAVELWGKQLPINEVAASAGTISYELVTRMPLRAPRHYLHR